MYEAYVQIIWTRLYILQISTVTGLLVRHMMGNIRSLRTSYLELSRVLRSQHWLALRISHKLYNIFCWWLARIVLHMCQITEG